MSPRPGAPPARAAAKDRAEWHRRLEASGKARRVPGADGRQVRRRLAEALSRQAARRPDPVATRKASEMALEAINARDPGDDRRFGRPHRLEQYQDQGDWNRSTHDNYGGRYIYYGIREFGMAAAMNGMAQHGGVIPYGGTFLVFSDYSRPAIRLGALSGAKVIHVMTHDSIGLGEDGPTHQPIEHLQALARDARPARLSARPTRSRPPNAGRWRWPTTGRALLALTRQNCRPVRTKAAKTNLCAQGAYRLKAAEAARKVILIATGSEVEIALDVAASAGRAGDRRRRRLHALHRTVRRPGRRLSRGHPARRFQPRNPARLDRGRARPSAGNAIPGLHGLRIGIDRFGASAPAADLYDYFGLTAPKITERVLAHMQDKGNCMTKVAINGFGRIGRLVARAILERARLRAGAGRDQRSRRRQVQCLAVQARQRPRRLPGRGQP